VKATDTAIPGVTVLEPRVHGDARGFFFESWNARTFAALGLDVRFVQDNHSRSAKGVLRGLHYQLKHPQGKLVRVVAGAAFDVAVDLRRSSPTFRRWIGVELTAENKKMLWIPPGFGHGFLSTAESTELVYKCTDFYVPEDELSLTWSDPDIGIVWPLGGFDRPQLAAKDANAPRLDHLDTYP
jgi:dTDP-4-dehydrorhamnose 3,5-epimerase